MEPPDPAALRDRLATTPGGATVLEALAGTRAVWLVGGAVRDLLLGETPPDLDLVVEGDAAAAARTAAERLGGESVVHDRFGTATVRGEAVSFDLAVTRSETYAVPGALPDVAPADLRADLTRRDFTVNAIALGLSPDVAGRLEAIPQAWEDLAARRLRVLHAASFTDDPTRLLRLVRYAARLGFAPETETERLARAAVADGAIQTVSGPRLGSELLLLTTEPAPLAALELAATLGVAGALEPRLAPDRDLADRALALLPGDGRRGLVVLATACTRMDRVTLSGWLDRLGFPASTREVVVAAATEGPALAAALAAATRPSEIAVAVGRRPPEAVAVGGALGPEPAARTWLDELRHIRLEIGGEDLMGAGVPEGPDVGRGLAAALAARLDGAAASREAELQAALAAVRD